MSEKNKAIAVLLKRSQEVWQDFQVATASDAAAAHDLWETWLKLRRVIWYLEGFAA